jgi:glycine/D-amino acid oxidase-like deaminating enzyme
MNKKKNDGKSKGLIVVVGAGSTGSSIAYHLAKSGQQVVLVERNQVGSGMTSRSSAIVRTHYSTEVVARMALYSLRIFENFGSIGASGFVKSGLLILAPAELRDGLIDNVSMLNRIGARNDVLEKSELARRFPEVDPEGCDYVVFEPESGYADSVGIANAYARAAAEAGAQILSGTEVSKLTAEQRTVNGVLLSDGSRINCSKVVLATNVWTNKLLEASGASNPELFPLWTVAHPIVVFRRPTRLQGVKPVIWDYPNKAYYKPEGQSLFYVGSLDPGLDEMKIDPDACPNQVSFEHMNQFSEAVAGRIPWMSEGNLHSSYVGMYDVSPDQHPIIDELSDFGLTGAFCCVGLSGHGFKLCPALGMMTAEMVLEVDGEASSTQQTFDRSLFLLSRFKTGKLLKSRYKTLATVA